MAFLIHLFTYINIYLIGQVSLFHFYIICYCLFILLLLLFKGPILVLVEGIQITRMITLSGKKIVKLIDEQPDYFSVLKVSLLSLTFSFDFFAFSLSRFLFSTRIYLLIIGCCYWRVTSLLCIDHLSFLLFIYEPFYEHSFCKVLFPFLSFPFI